MQLFK